MIYIIISNVGMAIMMIFVYFRYSRFRISSAIEIKELQSKYSQQVSLMTEADHKFLQETKDAHDKIQSLMIEIDELRKAKENELKLRLGAEKQIELTLQKTEDIERRMEDWQVMQDAVMNDCKDAMYKIGNDLYKKLNETYKQETETNKNLLGKVSKNISDFFDKFSTAVAPAHKEKASAPKQEVHVAAPTTHVEKVTPQEIPADDQTKKLISDLLETMEAGGHMANKDYFVPENFDEQRAKLMLCELAFYTANKLYFIDFKSCRYLAEYDNFKAQNKDAAEATLKQRFDKYLAYLSNPKYRASILKALAASKIKFDHVVIVAVVPSNHGIQVLKEIGYYQKANHLGLEINDFDEINNIIL